MSAEATGWRFTCDAISGMCDEWITISTARRLHAIKAIQESGWQYRFHAYRCQLHPFESPRETRS